MPTSHCTRARRPARRCDESGPREGDHARPYAVRIRNAVMRSLHVGSGFAGPMTGSSGDPLIADVAMSRHPEV